MVLKKIYIIGRYPEQNNLMNISLIDIGINNVEFSRSKEEADIILYFDVVEVSSSEISAKKVLVRQEPELVMPNNYKIKYTNKFDQIISVGTDPKLIENSVNWPQNIHKKVNRIQNRVSSKTVLVNSNLLNFKKSEMYSLRRTICFKSNLVDLYGFGWNKSTSSSLKVIIIETLKFLKNPLKIKLSSLRYFLRKQKNYKGIAGDKIKVMEQYKTSLIIENSLNYLSEKLFDAFAAGCIPIYVGPNLNSFNIPNSLFIQADPNYNSIIEKIQIANNLDYDDWLFNLNEWLSEEHTYYIWSKDTFLIRLFQLIKD
jgi:hypothetical protein